MENPLLIRCRYTIGNPTIVTGGSPSTITPPSGATTLLNTYEPLTKPISTEMTVRLQQPTWNTYSSILDSSYSGTTKRIYFAMEKNDNSPGNQGPRFLG
jgi:hypothetical protein